MAVSKATVVVGVVAALVVGGLGYYAWSSAQKRAQQRQVGALVADSTGKVKEALTQRATKEIVDSIDADRLLRQAASSRRALEVHMTRGRRGDSAWFREALELKKRVEADHTDLANVFKAYDEMLFDMTEIGKGLAPRIGRDGLLDNKFILEVRKQGQAEAANAMRELERVRRLTP